MARLQFKKADTAFQAESVGQPTEPCLVEFTPVAPMGRLDIDVPLTPSVDPIGPVLMTRKWERMDDTIIVQHADLEISVRWRHRSGLPFGGEGMHDVPP